jgi:hypothetical protein
VSNLDVLHCQLAKGNIDLRFVFYRIIHSGRPLLMGTIRNCKIDNIRQLYALKVTCMQNWNNFYSVVYELWIYFLTKTLLLEGLFFRNEVYNIIIMKNIFVLLIVLHVLFLQQTFISVNVRIAGMNNNSDKLRVAVNMELVERKHFLTLNKWGYREKRERTQRSTILEQSVVITPLGVSTGFRHAKPHL